MQLLEVSILEGMPSEKLENIIQQLEEFNPEIICGNACLRG